MVCWERDQACVIARRFSATEWTHDQGDEYMKFSTSGWTRVGCGERLEHSQNTSDASYIRFPYADEYTGMISNGQRISCPYDSTPSSRPSPCKRPFVD